MTMLVLTRKEGESVHIGGNIVVTVVATTGSRVRLGIEAPRNTSIRRNELPPLEEHVAKSLGRDQAANHGVTAQDETPQDSATPLKVTREISYATIS
jgi:carbon storage regulator